MAIEIFSFFLLALVLGIKHSFDADHLVAVSTMITRSRSLSNTVKMAVSWAVGHMATATLVTVLFFLFKDSLLSAILGHFELIVGMMLVVLGALSVYKAYEATAGTKVHSHEHSHDHPHFHAPMFGIGIVHGLASNDELLILLTVSLGLNSLFDMVVGVGVFSIGVILGMVLFGALFSYSVLKIRQEILMGFIHGGVGIISVGYGMVMLLGLLYP